MCRFSVMIRKLVISANKSKITHRHSAVIFQNKKRAFYGYNKHIGFSHCTHAEPDAIRTARKNRKFIYTGMRLLVIRHSDAHGLVMSKPCLTCQTLIDKFSFKKIYYSDEYGNIVKRKHTISLKNGRKKYLY